MRFFHRLTAASAMALLAGCVGFTEDGGFDEVRRLTSERIGLQPVRVRSDAEREALRTRVEALLAKPIGPAEAVEIALLNNRGLQAALLELGIAEADLVQAGSLPNPKLSFARSTRDAETSIERKFTFDVLGIVAIPFALEIEERRFAQARVRAAMRVLSLASEVRNAYFNAVAARQALVYAEQVRDAAEAGSSLGRRMAEAGNWSRLAQAREEMFHVEAGVFHARTRVAANAARERLIRLLGLDGENIAVTLPDRLPDLPPAPTELTETLANAMDRRLDVRMARAEIEGLAKSLGLTRATRFVNVLDASYLRNSETGKATETGYEVELSLPIFDWGEARVAKAELLYTQALDRVAEIAVAARSEIRETHAAYRAAHDIARRHRDEIVPLRAKIGGEMLLRYNGMLIGVFELLGDARERIGGAI